ncbi:DUF4174 domain-containing protein [Nonlabens xiamenensis]|uniref:DUF4174 domain-containing protein n=1 Tax=Nonlabens xiamenensis TaxID=2341043 RepID=UPI000F606C96|nr:DUF4174 domain-containing protein [Nonlabens xiamenensis]
MRWIILLFLMSIFSNAQIPELTQHQWNHRLLITFSDVEEASAQQRFFEQQKSRFEKNIEGLKERKLLLYVVFPNRYTQLNPENPKDAKWIAQQDLYKFVNKKDAVMGIQLIGLDGGTKLNRADWVELTDIFQRIDAMPMRQAEMKNDQKH